MTETCVDILCAAQSTVANGNPSTDGKIEELTTPERLDLAMQEAIAMTQLAPSSARGYLWVSHIHSLCGR
ncbi:hypothetical protein O0I10_011550 [Lichtheimia ornata]|uniref:Uncharacterized protein n=1 Tax=Lichtheimia ornata TaxID=688661 RepID=A0AAD7UV52_9FUNG|nr:uncharacterized protein O0I10_011550 [Lichtheimia ornata]KAJ8652811.1 hypothetical protein O0I10_011550 [Lichtheimia ornata]